MATALEIVQQVSKRMGIAVPTSLVSTDTDGVQMLALLNELGEELITRFKWQQLLVEKTWTTVNAEEQGSLLSIIGASAESLVSLTIWDETDQLFIDGPLTDRTFLLGRSTPLGIGYQYKIYSDILRITPVIPANHLLRFFIRSKLWVIAADGTTFKTTLSADDDSPLLPAELLRLGLRWKWREEKGLPYAELHRSFEAMAADLTARNATSPVVYLANSLPKANSGIFVKPGSTIP